MGAKNLVDETKVSSELFQRIPFSSDGFVQPGDQPLPFLVRWLLLMAPLSLSSGLATRVNSRASRVAARCILAANGHWRDPAARIRGGAWWLPSGACRCDRPALLAASVKAQVALAATVYQMAVTKIGEDDVGCQW
jgi:hypothetical protein